MSLLAPAALWLSLVGAAVVALYLLKIRRQRQTVPSLEFWLALAGRVRARSLFQRLKRWLSMLLWLLIVACLVLAIGNPILTLGRVKPQSIALIFDNSASMQTIEDVESKRTRHAEALAVLRDMLDRRPVDDQWLLIEAAREPRVLASWTRDRRAIRTAAERIAPASVRGSLPAARNLAADLLAGMPDPLIVIVSDGAAGGVETLPREQPPLIQSPVGTTDDNLGITLLRVRVDRQQTLHVALVRIVNGSSADISSQLVLSIDDSIVNVEPFQIAAGGFWEKTLSYVRPDGGVLKAVIDRPDSLATDNEAVAILEPLRAARLRLVTEPRQAYLFEHALVAMEPLVDAAASHTMSLEEYEGLVAGTPPADLTIFNNAAPAKLPESGAFIFVNSWPAEIPARIIGRIDSPTLSIARRDHALMQHLSMSAVGLRSAHEVALTGAAFVLADSAAGAPLIFLHREPDRVSLCLAFDVLASDLPFRNAFPLLLRNAVLNLVSEQRSWVRDQYAIGEPIEPLRALPAGIAQVAVSRAGTAADAIGDRSIEVSSGTFRFDDTGSVGALRFAIGDDLAFAAVNLTDEAETRIRPVRIGDEAAFAETLPLSKRLFATVPWIALAIIATTLVALEWLTYQWRWTE